MKNLNITFTNREFKKLKKNKPASWTWRAFIMASANLFRKKFLREF